MNAQTPFAIVRSALIALEARLFPGLASERRISDELKRQALELAELGEALNRIERLRAEADELELQADFLEWRNGVALALEDADIDFDIEDYKAMVGL